MCTFMTYRKTKHLETSVYHSNPIQLSNMSFMCLFFLLFCFICANQTLKINVEVTQHFRYAALKGVSGGIHEALKIPQTRYGQRCAILTSIVDGLVKGPAIMDGEKLQQCYAGLAKELEKGEGCFPTLSNFSAFIERWANIANHPSNSTKGKTPQGVFPKGNKVKKEEPMPRCTMPNGVMDDQNAQGKRDHKGTSCPCCSQSHPLNRCN